MTPSKIERAEGGEWTPASITAPYGKNNGVKAGEVEIVGWRRGDWFLDFRVNELEDGDIKGLWGLSHIPTGYFCCAVYGPLDKAKDAAAEIEAWGDWASAGGPLDIRDKFTPNAREMSLKYGGDVRFGIAPLWSQITQETSGQP